MKPWDRKNLGAVEAWKKIDKTATLLTAGITVVLSILNRKSSIALGISSSEPLGGRSWGGGRPL